MDWQHRATGIVISMANSPTGDALLDRVLRLFEALEAQPQLHPGELADRAGLPRTTGYRLIQELTSRGLLMRADSGEIDIGQRLWELAQGAPISRTLRQASLPYMQDVNAVVGQTTQLAVLEDAGVLIVERLSQHGAVVNPAEVASTMPAHLTSMGHALLAFSTPQALEEWWEGHQEITRAERPQLRRELAEAKTRGYAALGGLINSETSGISVPILNSRGFAEAALTIVVPRSSPDIPTFLMALQTAARGISRALHRHHR